jgi:hypothetical protein
VEEDDMPSIADVAQAVTGGADTHADTHVFAVVDGVGRVLGTRDFPATDTGHAAALEWMRTMTVGPCFGVPRIGWTNTGKMN